MNPGTTLQNAAKYQNVQPQTLAQRRANARLAAKHLPNDLSGAFHRFQRPTFTVAEPVKVEVSVEDGLDSWL